jgi:hypothetical protein
MPLHKADKSFVLLVEWVQVVEAHQVAACQLV